MTEILILAALDEEADAVFPDKGKVEKFGHLRVRRVGSFLIATCGLGKTNAALAAGLLVNGDSRALLMTGTCGRIGTIDGDTFWIAQAVQHDYGAREVTGFTTYRAGDIPVGERRDHAFVAMPDPGLGLPHATIASGDVFLQCPDTASALACQLGAQLVDMEAAAVAQAAEALDLPWAAIKTVTDDADGESAGDFRANLLRAARKSGAAIERLVNAL